MLPEKCQLLHGEPTSRQPSDHEGSEEKPALFPSHNNSKQSVKVVDFWQSRLRRATTHMHVTWPHHMTTIELEQGRPAGGSSITQLPDFERVLKGLVSCIIQSHTYAKFPNLINCTLHTKRHRVIAIISENRRNSLPPSPRRSWELGTSNRCLETGAFCGPPSC